MKIREYNSQVLWQIRGILILVDVCSLGGATGPTAYPNVTSIQIYVNHRNIMDVSQKNMCSEVYGAVLHLRPSGQDNSIQPLSSGPRQFNS